MTRGTLVPPWYQPSHTQQHDLLIATWAWGCTFGIAVFAGDKGVRQTLRLWNRRRRVNAYIIMIWLEWWACIVSSVTNWLHLNEEMIPARYLFPTVFPLASPILDRHLIHHKMPKSKDDANHGVHKVCGIS